MLYQVDDTGLYIMVYAQATSVLSVPRHQRPRCSCVIVGNSEGPLACPFVRLVRTPSTSELSLRRAGKSSRLS